MRNSFNVQDFAADRKTQLWKEYINSPNYIVEHYRSEIEAIEEYDGRQLLEMLQNADDASADATAPKALVKLDGRQLIIANTGHHFTEEGFESILYRNISPKFRERYVIGNKGLGFRSILSWIHKVSIFSGNLKVAFSEKHSQDFLYDLIKERPSIKDLIIKKNKKFEPIISTLRVPEVLNKIPSNLPSGFDTYIVLDLKEDIIQEVKDQILSSVDDKSLIFINHLEEVTLDLDGDIRILTAIRKRDSITIRETKNAEEKVKKWFLHSIEDEIEHKSKDGIEKHYYKLSVAWDPKNLKKYDHLYSYFKTMVPFEFPGLLHGTFELTPDRNKLLNKSLFNDHLIKEIPKLLCDASLKIAEQNIGFVNYDALHFLNIHFGNIDDKFKQNEFVNLLTETIKGYKILPSIANKYVTFNEDPKFFKNEVFPNLLRPDTFDDVLKNNTNENVDITLDGALRYAEYKILDLIGKIVKDSKYYSNEDYAKMMLAINDQYYFSGDIPPLFYDQEGSLLSFEDQIFVPDNDDFVHSLVDLKVQVISKNLFIHIKELLPEDEMDDFLEKFFLSKFTAYEVVELIVGNFTENLDSKAVVELNLRLFDLFKKYQVELETRWEGSPISFLTVNKKIAYATSLYFTKVYNVPLVHELYQYDKSKLVGKSDSYNIKEEEKELWKEYLIWAGVAKSPRKFYNSIKDESFAQYCLEEHDYSRGLAQENYSSYEKLKLVLTGFGKIKVYSVDGLELILQNNSIELIICWLFHDDELKSIIEKNIEPASSLIEIGIRKKQYYRELRGVKLKNYIRWWINQNEWLDTENNTKQSPSNCTIATNINEDFKGILDKPKINYLHPLFKKYGIKKNQIEYILQSIGVHESISTLSTKSLYNILLQLPEIDKEGKKVKTIYREIAANFEVNSLDKKDETYQIYLEEGKVYSESSAKEQAYLPLSEVYYVNDKRYGKSIIDLFNKVAIDRRQGKSKINVLFGVKPLENLGISITGETIFHPLNKVFESEIQYFKPYVYVFRQDYDKKGADRSRIKNTKFKLVRQLNVLVKKGKTDHKTVLGSYEYFNDLSKNEILIVVPDYIKTIEEAKNDVLFCSAVAESFSSLLDVDQQRNQLRELFSKNTTGRNQILADELDDLNTEKLQKAREALQILSNRKMDFWGAFLNCFPGKKLKNPRSDDELVEELKRVFSTDNFRFLKQNIEEINYEEFNTIPGLYAIIKILDRFKVTVEDINKRLYPAIDLTLVYQDNFEVLKDEYKPSFKKRIFEKLKSDSDLRSNFNSYLEKYDSLGYTGEAFNLNYNSEIETFLKQYVLEEFGIEIIKEESTLNLNAIYQENKAKLISDAETKKQMFDLFIENFPDKDSLLFFEGELNALVVSLKSFVNKVQKDNEGRNDFKNTIKFDNKEIFFDTYEELIDSFSENITEESINKWVYESVVTKKNNTKTTSNNSTKGKKGKRKNYSRNKHIGFLAEYFVCKYLELNIAKGGSVEWVSEYAREAGVNPMGKDGLGYDIKYIPKNAKTTRFVEVKAIGWDGSFNISSNEVKEAEALKSKHELFLVSNIENIESIKIERIPGMFTYGKGDNFYDNEKFSVLNDNFIIKYLIKREAENSN